MGDSTQYVSRFTHQVSRLFRLNPIIIKELRGHMRGPRAFWILTGYLGLLGVLAYGLYRITVATVSNYYGPGGPPQGAVIGQTMFVGLAFIELLIVCFITPALTAGTISGEYERRTSDMLLATPLRPASILWGKTVPALSYVLLLILAAIPLASVVYLFGGVVLRDMVQAVCLLGLTAVTYGALGLFFSALTRRTGRATVLSYMVVIGIIGGSLFAWAFIAVVRGGPPPSAILYANPLSAMASAILTPEIAGNMYGVLPLVNSITNFSGGPQVLGLGSSTPMARPLWQYTTALYLGATLVLYLLTAQLVKPVRRWRIGWRGVVGTLAILALLAGGGWVVFGTGWGSTGWLGWITPTPVPMVPVPVVPEMPVIVEREIVVELIDALAPTPPLPPLHTPTPVPTPTPPPTPPSFDAEAQATLLQDYLAGSLLPESPASLCDVLILGSDAAVPEPHIFLWAYCRTYQLGTDGVLQPGLGVSLPVVASMGWSGQGRWEIRSYMLDSARDLFPPVQQHLAESPYDEAAGEARLRERARALLGED